jgi:hypothetical protein
VNKAQERQGRWIKVRDIIDIAARKGIATVYKKEAEAGR